MSSNLSKWCLVGLMLALPVAAHAQFASGISSIGTAEISHPATLMRVQVIVAADGKSTAEALQAMKTRRDALKAQFVQLGATSDSIKFEEPKSLGDANEQSRRMEQLMRARMGGNAPKPKKEQGVKVAITVTAEWPLAGSPEDLLVKSQDLRKKIEEAAKPPAAPADAATEEQEEEAPQIPDYGENGPKPGEPVIVYAAKIPADERAKALTTAMDKAKAQATQLAKAANVPLGPLQSLTQSTSPGYNYRSGMNAVLYQMMQAASEGESGQAPDLDEMVGPEPSAIKLRVVVTATWGIK
jgi:uncharacterized protein YggE